MSTAKAASILEMDLVHDLTITFLNSLTLKAVEYNLHELNCGGEVQAVAA